jgi:hypothetical protein
LDQMREEMCQLQELAARPPSPTGPSHEQLDEALQAQRKLEGQVVEAQQRIADLERDLAWSGDNTMALSIAHEKDTKHVVEITQQKEHLELEVARLKAHADHLEQDLATAGVLAAEMMCAGNDSDELRARLAAVQAEFEEKDARLKQLQAELEAALAESTLLKASHAEEIAAMQEEIQQLHQRHQEAHEKLLAQIAELETASRRDQQALEEADAQLAQERQARLAAEEALEAAREMRAVEVASLQQQHAEVVADVQRVLTSMDQEMDAVLGEDLQETALQLMQHLDAAAENLGADREAFLGTMDDTSVYLSQKLSELKDRHAAEVAAAIEAARTSGSLDREVQDMEELQQRHVAEVEALHEYHAEITEAKVARLSMIEAERSDIAGRLTEAQRLRQMVLSRLDDLEQQQRVEMDTLAQAHEGMLQTELAGTLEKHRMEARLAELENEQPPEVEDHSEELEELRRLYAEQVAAARGASVEAAAARRELSDALEEMGARHEQQRLAADRLRERIRLAEEAVAEEKASREQAEMKLYVSVEECAAQREALASTQVNCCHVHSL